jgi:hypothetical protein
VELRQEYNGLFSEYKGFEVFNKEGENIGFVTKDALTGDINSILYHEREHTPGEPRISKDNAMAIASEYLKKWGHRLGENYELNREHLHCVWSDIGNQHAYVYQLDWRRKSGDIYLADGCYLEIDAVDGEVLMCCFPKRNCPMPGGLEDRAAIINADEAIAIVKNEVPCDAESWGEAMVANDKKEIEQGKIEIDIREKAEKYFEPVYGVPMLTWRVEIACDYYCLDETKNEAGIIETKGYFYTIDAKNGEILEVNVTS